MTIIVQDSFNRADTTTLGNAETGQTPQLLNSSTWGISSNQLYTVTRTNNDSIVWESGISDAIISTDIKLGSNEGIVFRVTDDSNYLLASITTTTTNLFRRQSGTYTSLASVGVTRTAGTTYHLEITCDGSAITLKIDGVTVLTTTSTFNQTATKHGLRNGSTSTTPRWDNFVVNSLGNTPSFIDGSTVFDLKQSIYQDNSLTFDVKQTIYNDSFISSDTKQIIYSDSSVSFDTLQQIQLGGVDGSVTFNTKQTLYSDSSVQFYTKQWLYSDSQAVFNTKQSYYSDGFASFDTLQVIEKIDWVDGSVSFDTQQLITETPKVVAQEVNLTFIAENEVNLSSEIENSVSLSFTI